jgi:hypothetical protein
MPLCEAGQAKAVRLWADALERHPNFKEVPLTADR